jgi:hypothetical protein
MEEPVYNALRLFFFTFCLLFPALKNQLFKISGQIMDNNVGADTNTISTESIQGDLAQEALSIYGSDLPLDSSKSEIRLLSLHNSDDENAHLSAKLERATLDDDYSALSYVWVLTPPLQST